VSVLLIDPDDELGAAIVARLLGEGDEVRVLAAQPGSWKDRGAFVATGDPLDTDLVERACTNVRTIVFTFTGRSVHLSLLDSALTPAAAAGVDRVIVCVPTPDQGVLRALDASGLSYVAIVTGRRGFLPKRTIEPTQVAEAVNAADDLVGEPKLVVDLTSEEGLAELKLGGHA
jgi:uncharacterized protein YbjT (DUF2867 family)